MSASALKFSPDELAAFREEYCKGATDAQFTLFIAECERRNLIPGQHIVFQLRASREWNPDINAAVSVKKVVKITTIDALRLISQRTGEYEGQGEGEFYYLDDNNAPTIVSKIPLPHPTIPNAPREPWAATIPIYRRGFREPVRVMARFDAYAVLKKSKNGEMSLSEVWARRAPEMLLKCAESGARRACFPEELAGLYISEEFDRETAENAPAAPTAEPQPLTEAPKAAIVPTVNHAPAVPTNEPRPGEEKPKPKKNVKDVKIEDVILDKVEVVSEVAGDNPEIAVSITVPAKALVYPQIDKPEPIVDVKIASQTQNVPPETTKPEQNTTVQKMDNPKPSSERCRDLIQAGANKEAFKAYVLRESGAADTKSVTPAQWQEILGPLETLLAEGGKDMVNAKLTTKPETEEEVF